MWYSTLRAEESQQKSVKCVGVELCVHVKQDLTRFLINHFKHLCGIMSKPNKAKVAKAVAPKRKGQYKMPDPIPNGEILIDLYKRNWKLGPSIGKGGFGEIYSATEVSATGKNLYVIKIEPKENGPLFVEMHYFMKALKSTDVENWMKDRKLKFLGLPRFVSHGSHVYNEKQYRFVVMERYGKNLATALKENNNALPQKTVYNTALHIIDALEYIHSTGYVHADVKASNLLFGLQKGTEDKVYLVDFGLVSRYLKEYKADPKSAHNGTIEYTSRDAHSGASTRRGDLEILGYNMVHWLGFKLPWENKLTDCVYVQNEKIKYMNDINGFLKECFKSETLPIAMKKFFNYVVGLAPTEAPDYELCRKILKQGSKDHSHHGLVVPVPEEEKKAGVQGPQRNLKKADKAVKVAKTVKGTARGKTENVANASPPRRTTRNIQNGRKATYNGMNSDDNSSDDDSSDAYSPTNKKATKRSNNQKAVGNKKKSKIT